MPFRVGVIVEGQGEYHAIRIVLERIWYDLFKVEAEQLDVLRAFRQPQGTLLKEEGLKKAANAVKIKLGPDPIGAPRNLVLILIDAEKRGCPREQAPQLLRWAHEARSDADIACVMPNCMFETWFAAAAASLAGCNGLPNDLTTPDDPEGNKLGKTWLKKQLRRKAAYSEIVDQPRFAAKMDLFLCRQKSPSFDKLCREFEKRLPPHESE